MKFQKKIGDYNVIANCPAEMAEQAESILRKLAELNEKGPELKNGTIIRFGWSDLKLVKDKDEQIIHEPDFMNNPFKDFLPQVTITIQVLTQQSSLLLRFGLSGLACAFSDQITLSKGCLQEPVIYLKRSDNPQRNDSGWHFGRVKDEVEQGAEDFEALYVFEILRIRPYLMRFLALPSGYLVIVEGEKLQAIVDSDNRNKLVK